MTAIYARQSIDKKDSISIESQIEKCKSKLHNSEKYKIYSDKGFSGKNTDRPQFIQMMSDIKQNLVTKVIVYKVDRISRAIVDFGNMMIEFQKHKVQFISYTENFDTTTPIGMAMLNIIMVFAQLERETIQQRITDNYYDRGKHGYYLGGTAPYGFTKIPATLDGKKTYTYIENKETAPIVQWIFNKYVSGNLAMNQIAGILNRDGYKTRAGNAWSSVTISRILHNPAYVKANADVYLYYKDQGATINNNIAEFSGVNGCYIYGFNSQKHTKNRFSDLSHAYLTLGMHKGIIESDIWLEAQEKMKNNKSIKNSGRGTHSWLSGLMKCGYCGRAVTVVPNNRGHNYITCCGRKLHVCYGRRKVIHLDDIESIVEWELLNHIKEYYSNIRYKNIQNNTNRCSPEINKLKIELAQIQQKINNLVNAVAEGNSKSIIYLNGAIRTLDKKSKEILQKIERYKRSEIKKYPASSINLPDYVKNWDNFNISKRKIIAQNFIEEVVITDDKIDIFYIE